MSAEEVFEVVRLGLVDGSTCVHALYDGSHVAEHERVHQSCDRVQLTRFIHDNVKCC